MHLLRLCNQGSPHSNGTPQVWELGTGELKDTLIGHTSHVVGVAFTPDGKKLLSAGWDETIKVGKQRKAATVHLPGVSLRVRNCTAGLICQPCASANVARR